MKNKKTISLLEYESYDDLSLKEKRLIEKLNKLNKDDLFDFTPKGIKARKYVGVVQINNKTIQVLPKIFTNNGEDNSFIVNNLLFMLSYTKKLKLNETEISSLSKSENIFEAIIYLFSKNLLELLKKDLIRNYEDKEENTNYLKGKLLMSKHLKFNLFNKSKFYSKFDEFTEDNLLNQVFKATVQKLIKITKSNSNFKLLTECDFILQDVKLRKISLNETTKVTFNRLNQIYKNSFNLAILLLFGNSVSLNSKNFESFSLMFDMNNLFEEFIGEFIKKEFKNEFSKIETQKANKYVFHNKISSNFSKFQLKPDIYLENKFNEILVIDTKYKRLIKDKLNYGVSQGDIYQMFLYGMRYFNEQEIKNIILLYPEYEFNVNLEEINLESKENINIQIKTVNLHRNLLKAEERKKLKEELKIILNK